MMADLIDLIERRGRATLPASRPSTTGYERSAQVLFFTGVRYERLEESEDRLDLSKRLDGAPRGSRGKGKRRA